MIPILYSFRRCPYAIRARLALDASEQRCELREVVLRNKPAEMLQASPKGTVPVLIDVEGTVIDESLDIMLWALKRHDPERWLQPESHSLDDMLVLIGHFDSHFKHHLDRYKYSTRYAGADAAQNRDEASVDVRTIEQRLESAPFLFGNRPALSDMAIAPFVRQFANVDAAWFASEPWPRARHWLETITHSRRFERIMRSLPAWEPGTQGVEFPFR